MCVQSDYLQETIVKGQKRMTNFDHGTAERPHISRSVVKVIQGVFIFPKLGSQPAKRHQAVLILDSGRFAEVSGAIEIAKECREMTVSDVYQNIFLWRYGERKRH